jgi:beta-ribofuranosylaminobenzene 5'-phosphate synthase
MTESHLHSRTSKAVHVSAPTRLHFGLLSFGNQEGRNFGGVGLMLKEPRVEITATPAAEFATTGPYAERMFDFAKQWQLYTQADTLPDCVLTVTSAPEQHVGLGLGTQLGLSTAEILQAFLTGEGFGAMERAFVVNRASRSAVGTYGFEFGGLIVERGRLPSERISPLECRLDFPEAWRIMLICPENEKGLSGEQETRAFGDIPPVSQQTTAQLIKELESGLLPGITAGDFMMAADAIENYGRIAGGCFSSIQGGPYNGRLLNRRVDWLKKLGAHGIGQSSWGPTLFCIFETLADAERFKNSMGSDDSDQTLRVEIVRADNQGADIS